MEENKSLEDNNIKKNNQNEQVKIEEKKSEVNNKFVPSYQNKEKSNTSVDKKKKNDNKKRKSFIWIIILAILLIVLGFGVYKIVNHFKYKKYEQYSNKMNIYGFERMYDNGKSNVSDKVTKSEAIKMVISTVFNLYDISTFAPLPNPEYDNQIWVDYAKDKEMLLEDVNSSNQKSKATYMDVIMLLSKAKTNLLELDLDIEGNPQFKDYSKYTNEQQIALKDMVWNKIIENNSSKLNGNRKISKGELNELLINFAEKYRTLTLNSEDDKFVINEEKLPYNYEQYPYLLSNVNKKIYEIKFYNADISKSKTPVELYADEKQKFSGINAMIRQYFNAILNVNYETIDFNTFKYAINSVSLYEYSDERIQDYINYIKENKIIISGTANLQMPIIYFDGRQTRARVIVEINVVQSDKLENLVFSDKLTGNVYKYSLGNNVKYVDVPFEKEKNTGNLYITMGSINKNIAGSVGK